MVEKVHYCNDSGGSCYCLPKPIQLIKLCLLLLTMVSLFLGIVLSFILPILRKAIPSIPNTRFAARLETQVKEYLVILAFSLVVGLLMLAAVSEILDRKTALLTGFAWDSTLQKLTE